MLFHLTYVSEAVQAWSQAQLVALLEQARTSNERRGVTGMLLYRDGRFLQLLEGAEGDVRDLYATIEADARHRDVTVVRTGRRVLRQFPSWTMAFRDLGEEPLSAPGFADVLGDLAGSTDPAVDALVAGLRANDRSSRTSMNGSRVLGHVAGTPPRP